MAMSIVLLAVHPIYSQCDLWFIYVHSDECQKLYLHQTFSYVVICILISEKRDERSDCMFLNSIGI